MQEGPNSKSFLHQPFEMIMEHKLRVIQLSVIKYQSIQGSFTVNAYLKFEVNRSRSLCDIVQKPKV